MIKKFEMVLLKNKTRNGTKYTQFTIIQQDSYFLLSFQTSTNDHKRIRCVSVTILTVIVIIIGGIVGILMGLLD